MSLIQDVVDLIDDYGPATGPELKPRLPGLTLEQIFQALQNAKYTGRLEIIDPSKALGKGAGKTPARYGMAAPKERVEVVPGPRPVASVWELGARAAMGARA